MTRPKQSVRSSRRVRAALAVGLTLALLPIGTAAASAAPHRCDKPTVVLVHGAWANGSSWNGVAVRLRAKGYRVKIAPNSLRGLSLDTAELKRYLATIKGPIVLAGHSYGGAVITNGALGDKDVKALVYDDAYIPDQGENASELSTSASALAVANTDPTAVFKLVPYDGAPDKIYDTYLLPHVVKESFAPDVSARKQAFLTRTQPPTSLLALGEPSGPPAWKTIPSWDVVGRQDKIIPIAAQLAMAKRAGSHVVEIDSSHVSLISHPKAVADVIATAARATTRSH